MAPHGGWPSKPHPAGGPATARRLLHMRLLRPPSRLTTRTKGWTLRPAGAGGHKQYNRLMESDRSRVVVSYADSSCTARRGEERAGRAVSFLESSLYREGG